LSPQNFTNSEARQMKPDRIRKGMDDYFDGTDESDDMNQRRERETKTAWAILKWRDFRRPVRSEDLPA